MTTKDKDDVIIYRCLMVILLFRTAADSGKILESGLYCANYLIAVNTMRGHNLVWLEDDIKFVTQ